MPQQGRVRACAHLSSARVQLRLNRTAAPSDTDDAAAANADARHNRHACRELHSRWTRIARTADDRVQTRQRNAANSASRPPTAVLTCPKLLWFEKSRLSGTDGELMVDCDLAGPVRA